MNISKKPRLPEYMRAAQLTGHGGLDKLVLNHDVPLPQISDDEVLIRVAATGINNTDVNTRIGWYSSSVTEGTTRASGLDGYDSSPGQGSTWGGSNIQFPRIQGADVCGRIVATGKNVNPELNGRRVLVDPWFRDWNAPNDTSKTGYFGSEHDGGFAEYTKAHHNNVHAVESDLSDTELASFATSYITAENMLERAGVKRNERILITGASGGVGSALIQLARRRGATTVAVASPTKHEPLRQLGAHHCLPRKFDHLDKQLSEITGSAQVDVVADVVGGEHWPQLIRSLVRNGRYVCAGAIAGPIVEFDLRPFYLNDLEFYGATVVSPGLFSRLVKYIEQNEIKPLIAATFPLEQIHQAQSLFLEKSHVGNIVITIE